MKINNSKKIIVLDILLVIAAIVVDQIVKKMIEPLHDKGPIVLINNVLEFTYLENRGAAFGILQGQKIFFLIIAVVVTACMIYVFIKIPAEKKYIKLNIVLAFVLAGAIGNTIDRMWLGYVRDFIYFRLIDFPVFNVADIYITVCMVLLVLLILFGYKEEELTFLKSDKNNNQSKSGESN